MTQEERIAFLEQKLAHLEDLYFRAHLIDRVVHEKPVYFEGKIYLNSNIYFKDGSIVSTGTTTGTQFGNATSEKIGFYGKAPVDRPDTVSDPAGGITQDAEARTAINTIIDRLQELGLIA